MTSRPPKRRSLRARGRSCRVHLYGQMADMAALRGLAERHGLALIEDACQAHGATRDGLRAGGAGNAGAFSFYPGKNLGAFGDAGALVTDDEDLARRVRALREHGQRAKYQHEREGWTARLDSIQALVLLQKLPHLEGWIAERRLFAAFYLNELAALPGLALPAVPAGSDPVWHLFVVRTDDPQALAHRLAAYGIQTSKHYPEAVHRTQAYAHLGRPGAFPVAEDLARECLSLPIFPSMTRHEATHVAETLRRLQLR